MKRANLILLKEPSIMSTERIPSREIAGSMEYLSERLVFPSNLMDYNIPAPAYKMCFASCPSPSKSPSVASIGSPSISRAFIHKYELLRLVLETDLVFECCPLESASFQCILCDLEVIVEEILYRIKGCSLSSCGTHI